MAEGSKTYLVAETLGGNDGDLIADTLVGLEVEGEAWVVALNEDLGGLLDGLFFVLISMRFSLRLLSFC